MQRSAHVFPMTAALAALVGLAGCGSDTGRSRVDFDVNVTSIQLTGAANEFGYTVTLSRAELNLARLAFFDGEPLFTKSWPQRLSDLIIPSAYAHPGHYTPGEAMGDLLNEQQFDLLDTGPTRWGTANGVTGSYASAELDLGGQGASSLILEGVATGPAGEISFIAEVEGRQEIIGLTAGFDVVDQPFQIMVTVDLNELIKRMDFGRVATTEEMAQLQPPLTVGQDTQPYNAFIRAAIGNGTYRFEMMGEN